MSHLRGPNSRPGIKIEAQYPIKGMRGGSDGCNIQIQILIKTQGPDRERTHRHNSKIHFPLQDPILAKWQLLVRSNCLTLIKSCLGSFTEHTV